MAKIEYLNIYSWNADLAPSLRCKCWHTSQQSQALTQLTRSCRPALMLQSRMLQIKLSLELQRAAHLNAAANALTSFVCSQASFEITTSFGSCSVSARATRFALRFCFCFCLGLSVVVIFIVAFWNFIHYLWSTRAIVFASAATPLRAPPFITNTLQRSTCALVRPLTNESSAKSDRRVVVVVIVIVS